jgi:hypothetical protein
MVAVGEEEDLERAVVEDAQEEVEALAAATMATAPGTASTTTTERTSMVHASTPISARIHQTLALVGNTSGDVEDVLEEMGLAVGTPDIAIHEAFKDSGYRSSLGPAATRAAAAATATRVSSVNTAACTISATCSTATVCAAASDSTAVYFSTFCGFGHGGPDFNGTARVWFQAAAKCQCGEPAANRKRGSRDCGWCGQHC